MVSAYPELFLGRTRRERSMNGEEQSRKPGSKQQQTDREQKFCQIIGFLFRSFEFTKNCSAVMLMLLRACFSLMFYHLLMIASSYYLVLLCFSFTFSFCHFFLLLQCSYQSLLVRVHSLFHLDFDYCCYDRHRWCWLQLCPSRESRLCCYYPSLGTWFVCADSNCCLIASVNRDVSDTAVFCQIFSAVPPT